MPGLFDVKSIWDNVREIDLRPIRENAEQVTWIALVGGDANARQLLSKQICQGARENLPDTDSSRGGPEPISVDLANAAPADGADLIVLLVGGSSANLSNETDLVGRWVDAGRRVLVLNLIAHSGRATPGGNGRSWPGAQVLWGSVTDRDFIERQFVPAVLELLPDRHLSLARFYPLFRMQAAQQLIAETAKTNAAYALSTGFAEIIPLLDVPFNVADMVVLTKAQAMMAYKLGLALGLSGRWQDHMAAFGGTVGTGFLWRQIARELVGLIPFWGIIPKVAVSYAGTYVLGQAILHWYLTGRKVTPAGMRTLYKQAFDQGKQLAMSMLDRAPRLKRRAQLGSGAKIRCQTCGRENPASYKYCGNCGSPVRVAS